MQQVSSNKYEEVWIWKNLAYITIFENYTKLLQTLAMELFNNTTYLLITKK